VSENVARVYVTDLCAPRDGKLARNWATLGDKLVPLCAIVVAEDGLVMESLLIADEHVVERTWRPRQYLHQLDIQVPGLHEGDT
jgi:hypothetical protein